MDYREEDMAPLLSAYQRSAHVFATYPREHALCYVMLKLCGEAAELVYASGTKHVRSEIGDVLWYCAEACTVLGEDLGARFAAPCDASGLVVDRFGLLFEAAHASEAAGKALREGFVSERRKVAILGHVTRILRIILTISGGCLGMVEAAHENIKKLEGRAERGTIIGDGEER